MKKILILFLLFAVPFAAANAQKLSKAEKEAIAKAAYEKALNAINSKNFIIVPTSFTNPDGTIEENTDNANLLLVQGEQVFLQGVIVCDNTKNNIAELVEYNVTISKKGAVRVKMVVQGRMVKGTYTISMRNNGNVADVIFNPQSGGKTRKFTGPVTVPSETSYNKRSNPI